MIVTVASGKGGTGKTAVAAALAHLASHEMPIVLADADVDVANLELVLDPTKREEQEFMGGQVVPTWRSTWSSLLSLACRRW